MQLQEVGAGRQALHQERAVRPDGHASRVDPKQSVAVINDQRAAACRVAVRSDGSPGNLREVGRHKPNLRGRRRAGTDGHGPCIGDAFDAGIVRDGVPDSLRLAGRCDRLVPRYGPGYGYHVVRPGGQLIQTEFTVGVRDRAEAKTDKMHLSDSV